MKKKFTPASNAAHAVSTEPGSSSSGIRPRHTGLTARPSPSEIRAVSRGSRSRMRHRTASRVEIDGAAARAAISCDRGPPMPLSADAARRHTLGDILRRTAARLPGKTAVICGELTWSYAELDQITNRLANGLAARGVTRGDRVAILSRNSHAFVALRFALARLGAVLVPINFMLNADEVAYVLHHAGARLLAVGPDLVALA